MSAQSEFERMGLPSTDERATESEAFEDTGGLSEGLPNPPYNYAIFVYDDAEHRTTRRVDVWADWAEVNEHGDAIFYAEGLKDVPVMRRGLFGIQYPARMETIERLPVAAYAAGSYAFFFITDSGAYGILDPLDLSL